MKTITIKNEAKGWQTTKNGTPIYYASDKKTFKIPTPPAGFERKNNA